MGIGRELLLGLLLPFDRPLKFCLLLLGLTLMGRRLALFELTLSRRPSGYESLVGVVMQSSPLTAQRDDGSLVEIEEEDVGLDNVYSREWLEVESAVDVELLEPSRVCGRY